MYKVCELIEVRVEINDGCLSLKIEKIVLKQDRKFMYDWFIIDILNQEIIFEGEQNEIKIRYFNF